MSLKPYCDSFQTDAFPFFVGYNEQAFVSFLWLVFFVWLRICCFLHTLRSRFCQIFHCCSLLILCLCMCLLLTTVPVSQLKLKWMCFSAFLHFMYLCFLLLFFFLNVCNQLCDFFLLLLFFLCWLLKFSFIVFSASPCLSCHHFNICLFSVLLLTFCLTVHAVLFWRSALPRWTFYDMEPFSPTCWRGNSAELVCVCVCVFLVKHWQHLTEYYYSILLVHKIVTYLWSNRGFCMEWF